MTQITNINGKEHTAGELSAKAYQDSTRYNSMEIAHALTEDIAEQLMTCALNHEKIFDEEEFFVCYVLAGDPLLKNLMRRKFFGLLHLPNPRPDQAVFLYNKKRGQFIKRLWILPNAETMALLSESIIVEKGFELMKFWSDAFFSGDFHEKIRKQHNINHLTEKEYLKVNADKYIQAGMKQTDVLIPQPFDFAKIQANQVVHTPNIIF